MSFGSEPRFRYRRRVHSMSVALEAWVYSQEECITAKEHVEDGVRYGTEVSQWYTHKAETHRGDGRQSWPLLSLDGTLRRRSPIYSSGIYLTGFERSQTFSHIKLGYLIVIDNGVRRRATVGCLAHHRPHLPPLASVPSSPDFSHRIASGCTYYKITISVRWVMKFTQQSLQ